MKELENINLLKKYDVYAFDYIEYPHKSYWEQNVVTKAEIANELQLLSAEESPNSLLYVHIPFCEELCSFCICHREITKSEARVKDYLYEDLTREIKVISDLIQKNTPNLSFTEIYFGGGSPTILDEQDFKYLLTLLRSSFRISSKPSINIEIDPRRIQSERLKFYSKLGVNKLSFGIQDFDPVVQKYINRIQPKKLIENLLTSEVRKLYKSINFDLLVGLPGQTTDTIADTITAVCELQPSRISLAYLHYGPKHHPHQRLMLSEQLLPDFYDRKILFETAVRMLLDAGYQRTGFEHFAHPSDLVAESHREGKALYNSLGSTAGLTENIIAIGKSAYSTLGDIYYQLTYNMNEYKAMLENQEMPIYRGYRLSQSDKIRRHIIKTIRTYFYLKISTIEEKYRINFNKEFRKEIEILHLIADDGLLRIDEESITLTDVGKYHSNLIASVFDTFIDRSPYRKNIKIIPISTEVE